MKPQTLHAQEDRLLDFVYGELPPLEARAVESHLEGCSRCSELLADIRGVRSTMAQLSVEPAPDAGLESLMAYAQQAARNAAAGPAPQPTWWRRWLVPACGVAAVCVFGIVTLEVSEKVDLSPAPVAAQNEVVFKAEAPAPSAPEPVPAPAGTAAPATTTPAPESEPMAGMTPPPPAPAAKMDSSFFDKEAARKSKKAPSAAKVARPDYSNAGTGGAFARDAYEQNVAEKRGYDYDRRDAMTQSGAPSKPKPLAAVPPQEVAAPSAPPPPPQQPSRAAEAELDEVGGTEAALVAEAQVQQQALDRGSLRVGGGVGGTAGDAYGKNEDFDDLKDAEAKQESLASLEGAKTSQTRREQLTRAPAAEPAPGMAPPPAAAPSMPSAAGPSTASVGRTERSGPSPAELSKMATAAFREGNRVREAQLLRMAVNAGATGAERLGLLNRLCDAEFAIGRREAAIEACSLVLKENPKSTAAQMARSRLNRESPATQEAKPGARGALKAAPVDKREAPASSAPAEAK